MYLAPQECSRPNPRLTGVPVRHIRGYLCTCKARTKLLILDTCHAGTEKSKAVGIASGGSRAPSQPTPPRARIGDVGLRGSGSRPT